MLGTPPKSTKLGREMPTSLQTIRRERSTIEDGLVIDRIQAQALQLRHAAIELVPVEPAGGSNKRDAATRSHGPELDQPGARPRRYRHAAISSATA